MHYTIRFSITLSMLALLACSGAPSEGTIRSQVIANLTKGAADELLEIQNFRKTNGLQKDDHTYIADVHYELVLRESVADFAKHLEATVNQASQASGGEAAGAHASDAAQIGGAFAAMGVALMFGDAKAGSRYPRDEKVVLVKTERGWQLAEQ